MNTKQMVEKFQCPGCVAGSDTNCGSYKPSEGIGAACEGHVLGTIFSGIGNIALGFPKGFCRPGYCRRERRTHSTMAIRLFTGGTYPEWDVFNVPVWAKIEDGFLFVRTFMPRVNGCFTDVIEGGTLDLVPTAIDVTNQEMD